MAPRREYEMMFSLNAQLGGNFSGTFSKAQQQLLSMQKEIQDLNKTQGNISAYEKQQQAVEGTQRKLEVLQQQYDNIQKEIQETGGFSADLENKLLSKQQQIDNTSASLERQTQKLDQLGSALREAGVDTGNLEKESERLAAEMADLKKREEEVAEGAEALSAAGAALAAAGVAAGLNKIYNEYKECASVAAEYEASMSNVEAISGATAEELAQLSAMAKELGATTKFTAKESADAMGYMAMAGWSAQQMLDGMPSVLTLAAASGEDLARVSDIVTDSMTAFGLSASETSRYADVLAATAANANTSVGVMGETFKYAAPVAGALGYSIEDVSTAIGLMANAGIKGSNAGTALRNVFNGLLGGVTLTSEAFGECEVSAVQADGSMADLAVTVDELRGYFDQMSEAERVNNAINIAGQRGYAGLLAILNASESDYAKLTDSINNCTGAAQRMADTKMDNMVGRLTLLNSAWEAVQTTVGEQLTPALSDLYSAGADVLSDVNAFLQRNPDVIKGVTIFIGVVGGATSALTAYAAIAKVIKTLEMGKVFASVGGPLLILSAAVGAYTALMVSLTGAEQRAAKEIRGLTEASHRQYDEIKELRKEYEEARKIYGENSEQAEYLAWRIDELTENYEAGKQSLDDYLRANERLRKGLDDTLDANRDAYDQINRDSDTTMALVSRLQALAGETEHTTASQVEMKAIIAELNRKMPELALSYEDVISGATDYAGAVDEIVAAETRRLRYEAAQEGMGDAMRAQIEAEREYKDAVEQQTGAQERYNQALADYNALKNADITSYMPGEDLSLEEAERDLNAAKKALDAYDAEVAEWDKTLAQANADVAFYEGVMTEYTEAEAEAAKAEKEAAEAKQQLAEEMEAVNDVIASAEEEIKALTEAYNEAYNAAYTSIHGQYELWDEAGEVTAKEIEDINAALESQIEHWNTYNSNLLSLREREGDIEGLSDVIASFADGSNDSVAAIAGMAEASDEDLKKMVQQWKDLQQSQNETSDTIAEFKTNFTEQMAELTQELREDIRTLDMSDEAAESGRVTIQGFIDAAEEETVRVQAAYAKLGRAAAAAMGTSVNGYGWGLPGYASGTDYADAGLALVGENGPELIMMRGGEKVLSAQETAEALSAPAEYGSGGGYVVTFAPIYNISGNMSAGELEEVLRDHDSEMRDQLEELLEEISADKARRAY